MEVLRGPGTVLYGSDALTGVIADSAVISSYYVTVRDHYGPLGQMPFDPGLESSGITEKVGFFADPEIPADAESQIVERDFREVPVIWIAGDADPFCAGNRAPIAEAAALGLSNCGYSYLGIAETVAGQTNSPHEVHLLPGAGHVPTNDPGPANDLVDDFIDKVLANNPPHFTLAG